MHDIGTFVTIVKIIVQKDEFWTKNRKEMDGTFQP